MRLWLSDWLQIWLPRKPWRALNLLQHPPAPRAVLANAFATFYKSNAKSKKKEAATTKNKQTSKGKSARLSIHPIGNYCGSSDNDLLACFYLLTSTQVLLYFLLNKLTVYQGLLLLLPTRIYRPCLRPKQDKEPSLACCWKNTEWFLIKT